MFSMRSLILFIKKPDEGLRLYVALWRVMRVKAEVQNIRLATAVKSGRISKTKMMSGAFYRQAKTNPA